MESPPFSIRSAVLEDLDALAAIDAVCFPEGIAYSRREIESLAFARQARTLVAESSRKIIGFACLGFGRTHSRREWLQRSAREPRGKPLRGELITIDVLPAFRRACVATRLYRALEDWLRAKGGAGIELHVSVENGAAIAFYARLGFHTAARVPGYYLRIIDAWRMEKPL